MTPEQIRLECLRLAMTIHGDPDQIMTLAALFDGFVWGRPTLTPLEQISAILKTADVK